MRRKAILFFALLALLLAGGLLLAAGNGQAARAAPQPGRALLTATCSTSFCLDWHVLGGEVAPVESASYRMQGTLGQTMAGLFDSASYRLAAGYWHGLEPPKHDVYLPLTVKP